MPPRSRPSPARRSAAAGRGTLRVIGGRWRGRRLAFAAVEGLRPTPDRVRETLFNWLAPLIEGARCLDLFAGSGALGIEALSRGAAAVRFVERDARACALLRDNLALLGAEGARVEAMDALAFLARPAEPFDVVFVDPPFALGLHAPACARLAEGGWLAPGARVYLESGPDEIALPEGWQVLRDKTAGQVRYRLLAAGS